MIVDQINAMLASLWALVNDPTAFNHLVNNRFILVLLVIVLMRMRNMTFRSMWAAALIDLPGTFLHEVTHYIVGGIMNAKPTGLSLWPRRLDNGAYVMGSVSMRNITAYNALPSSIAPLLLLPLGFWVNNNLPRYLAPTFLNYLIFVFILALLIESAVPSRQDIRVACSKPVGLLLYIGIFAGILLMY